MTSAASQTTSSLDLDEAQIARDAERMARYLQAADVHRDDQAQAAQRRRGEQQTEFDERGLPRGLPQIA